MAPVWLAFSGDLSAGTKNREKNHLDRDMTDSQTSSWLNKSCGSRISYDKHVTRNCSYHEFCQESPWFHSNQEIKKKNSTWHSICSWRFIKTPSDLTQPANPSRSSAKTVIVTTSRPRNSVSYSLQRSKTCLRWCIPAPHFLSRMMGNLLEIMLNATFWHMVLWLFSIQIVLLLTAKPLVWGHGKPANQRIYPGETWRMRKKSTCAIPVRWVQHHTGDLFGIWSATATEKMATASNVMKLPTATNPVLLISRFA